MVTAELAVAEAEASLERYRDNDRVAAPFGPERYADGLARRARRVEDALLALGAAHAAATPIGSSPPPRSSGADRA